MSNAAVAAIEYAIQDIEGLTFLRYWFHGDFDVIRAEWDDVPEDVLIGADPLHPETTIEDGLDNMGPHGAPEAALVEALEQCITSMLDSGYRTDAVVIRAARAALAAHRKDAEQGCSYARTEL